MFALFFSNDDDVTRGGPADGGDGGGCGDRGGVAEAGATVAFAAEPAATGIGSVVACAESTGLLGAIDSSRRAGNGSALFIAAVASDMASSTDRRISALGFLAMDEDEEDGFSRVRNGACAAIPTRPLSLAVLGARLLSRVVPTGRRPRLLPLPLPLPSPPLTFICDIATSESAAFCGRSEDRYVLLSLSAGLDFALALLGLEGADFLTRRVPPLAGTFGLGIRAASLTLTHADLGHLVLLKK